MERFTVAAVQMNALKGDLQHNLEVHRRIAGQAAQAGARLVVFPELSVTAHFGEQEVSEFAQAAEDGSIYQDMHDLAKRLKIVISYGFCEKAYGTFYNSQALVGPQGMIGVQRKVHASRDEYFYFRMGRSLDVFDLGFCRVGTLICFDNHFCEAWRVLALKGAEVILSPHAARRVFGPDHPADEEMLKVIQADLVRFKTRQSLYAKDNQVFSVYAGQWGYNGYTCHGGGAYVMDPDGEVLVEAAPALADLWVKAEIDPLRLHEVRSRPNAILKARRPELYGELTKMI